MRSYRLTLTKTINIPEAVENVDEYLEDLIDDCWENWLKETKIVRLDDVNSIK